MLNLILDENSLKGLNVMDTPSKSFNLVYEDEWFEDELVVKMIKDIDKVDIEDGVFTSKLFGTISPSELSTGVKGLILMLKEEGLSSYWFLSSRYGENCHKWIFYISSFKDINLYVNSFFIVPKDLFEEDHCKVNFIEQNKIMTDWKEINDIILSY